MMILAPGLLRETSRMQMSDHIIIDIQKRLDGLPSTPLKPCIHRVDSHLSKSEWDSNYHPEIISIGPYHYGNSRLQNMEQLKYRYLRQLLKRKNEQSLDIYVIAAMGMEERARKCYSEPLDLDGNEFVTLMVLDGCFLIELLRYSGLKNLRDANDPTFAHDGIRSHLLHDILLLENQLPFFVVNQLFNMTKSDENPDDELISLALNFVNGLFLNSSFSGVPGRLRDKNVDHIFGLIHNAWCFHFAETVQCVTYVGKPNDMDRWDNINSISELWEAGIKFKTNNQSSGSLMDIRFVNGLLRIPQLKIFDETESQFRNLIAYEQFLPDGEPRYASDYAFFMHCLINNSNDVFLLRGRGIIENCLGNDEDVCLMFNRLGKNILTSSNFCYSQVFRNVNKYCLRRPKRWKANLRRNYFNSPWSIISFLAAVVLLSLTLIQTTYTVCTYYYRKR